jgi:hypothetical protein
MSSRLNPVGVYGGEGREVVEDGRELLAQPLDFAIVETDAGKERDMFHIVLGKAHAFEDTACALYRIASGKAGPLLHSDGMSDTAFAAPPPRERRETR